MIVMPFRSYPCCCLSTFDTTMRVVCCHAWEHIQSCKIFNEHNTVSANAEHDALCKHDNLFSMMLFGDKKGCQEGLLKDLD